MLILSIVCHLGGGVGAVLKNWIEHDIHNTHIIACLNNDDPRSETVYVETHYGLCNNFNYLNELVKKSDIVVFHFYNNPLYYELLINNGLPKCRLVVWSHSNTLYPPYVLTYKLVDMCDKFIVTSPSTYESYEFKNLTVEQKKKFDVIWSVANMSKFSNIPKIKHDTFNIGYVGTIDFSKLNPDFIKLCSQINIPNVRFIVCGNGPDLSLLKRQIIKYNMQDKFILSDDWSKDVPFWVSQMDLFGYPLYERNCATCEQVIGEAMSAGLVPVVLNNRPESYIIINGVNGIVTDKNHYASSIEDLYNKQEVLNKMSIFVKEFALLAYDTSLMIDSWNKVFADTVNLEKKERRWLFTGEEIFKQSLGSYGDFFSGSKSDIKDILNSSKQWTSQNKGSVYQYARYFPNDKKLQYYKQCANELIDSGEYCGE